MACSYSPLTMPMPRLRAEHASRCNLALARRSCGWWRWASNIPLEKPKILYDILIWYGNNLCFMILWYKYTIFMFYGFSKIYDPSPIFMIYWYGMEINLWYEICLLYLEKMIHLILTFMIYLYDIYILKHTIDDQEHLVSIPSYHIWHICIFYISIC